ncbi:membrane protein [Bacteroidia bacterium]|nr:membrane protein [Bacteroidia bacterium]
MKKNKLFFMAGLLILLSSCSLDFDPLGAYSDVTEGVEVGLAFTTKADIVTHRQSMYIALKECEHFYQDVLLFAEIHSDNAYSGNEGGAPPGFEKNDVADMMAKPPLQRGWNRRMTNIALANKLISNIDNVPDPALTNEERRQYKAEALIYRALLYYDMALLWGRVPVVIVEAGDITAENIGEAYEKYFPKQNTEEEVYAQIEEDLLAALPDAPTDNGNKSICSKGLACTLLAKIYADNTPLRNYDKVIQYCDQVRDLGFSLVGDFSDLFGVQLQDPASPPSAANQAINAKRRNTEEAILEIQFSAAGDRGSFNNQIFGPLLDNFTPVTFANWVLPTHELIDLYESESGDKRYPETIVYYGGTQLGFNPPRNWGYTTSHYPHMYKFRSSFSSNIKYRYADILLLKAEALILKPNPDLTGAANIINQIRRRAGLQDLPSSATANKDAALDAMLKERRKELAFEGHRWNDLVRLEKVEDVLNSFKDRDPYSRITNRFTRTHYKFPIQKAILDANDLLTQNPGY